jgi:hypothetical protein
MSKFICGIITATPAIIAMIGVIGAITVPAAGSPSCMTKEEARKAYPGDHIYWHGPQHCWDNKGAGRRQASTAVNANSSGSATTPPEIDTPNEAVANSPSEPAADTPSEPVIVPPVRFISDELSRGLSWPVLNIPTFAQQDEPSPPPAAEEDVVIGAPAAVVGSPEYLLENCCWPPSLSEGTGEHDLRRMIIASTSACGLATGLWLFVYRRRQLARLAVVAKSRKQQRWREPSIDRA